MSNVEDVSMAVEQPAEESAPVESVEEQSTNEKLTRFPLARVKTIIKMDPDVQLASQEAVFLITKATELFVENLAKEVYAYTSKNKKKTLARNDVDTAIASTDCLAFLDGALED